MVRWARNAAGLAAGSYVDTVDVASGSLQARILDTLVVTRRLMLALSPRHRRDSVRLGTNAFRLDSTDVIVTGTGNEQLTWTASHRTAATWNSLLIVSGVGTGKVRWIRQPAALTTSGAYVDTIVVAGAGLRDSLIDSLIVVRPLTVSLDRPGTRDSVALGIPGLREDSIVINLEGPGATTASWSVSIDPPASWLTVSPLTGIGPGKVRVTRQSGSLLPGMHSTIVTVVAEKAENSPARFADTLHVMSPPVDALAVIDGLLGKRVLTPAQLTYLDAIGNANGGFDVGDLLAYSELPGVSLPRAHLVMAIFGPRTDSGGATTSRTSARKRE
jgi:hypothetical protein